jgi:acetylornithine deacetylase/succinyl-diaminopimelate desuccinylase-like protein
MAGSYPPARTSPDLPVSREVISIVRKVSGDVVVLPTLGGSIPMYLFKGPVIGLPIANHDDNQHASDENLRLQNLWDGIEVYRALFAEMK